ncbi:MAG TPA: hypothetical protein VH559_14625 [Gemmatimonadaceae bacterium]|jgi:hypothetical protein
MTDSDRSLSEVPGLIEERRRYEGWLASLDARKDSTPKHVFERVQADYRGRLERVAEQLASYRQAIEEERTSVQSRIALLEAEEQLQRDERAELELRAHVGELSRDDADAAFAVVDSEIERLVKEKTALTDRVDELVALLDEGTTPKTPPRPGPVVPAEPVKQGAKVSPPDSFAATAPAQLSIGQTVDSRESATAVSTAGLAAAATASGSNGSFDELAFLSSVVGKSETDIIEQPAGSEPPLTIDGLSSEPVLRQAGTIEQAKTLKCNECGAMNYPTEWYCERCGAELATL